MSVVGQSRRFGRRPITSGLRLETDIVRAGEHVSKVPEADVSRVVPSLDPSFNMLSVGVRAMVQDRPIRVERRLSAIMDADVAGYSRLMHNDEELRMPKLRHF